MEFGKEYTNSLYANGDQERQLRNGLGPRDKSFSCIMCGKDKLETVDHLFF